ncbi:MAG TPA: nitroreductase family deazaflavin-dependent oxidoreductase [Candidatus Dormibacteraeota bacterium]|nr:nitroreductase family deazaflavin-dependent oxidoreductase [Candidatus Dormibacteraeota bacterium]
MNRAPALIRLSNPLSRGLLRLGMPMGPNTLLTVRGRTSSEPRSAAVAVMEMDDRRWIIGAYGAVQWVQNLRAAGEADIQLHGKAVHVRATELDRVAAARFFKETMPAYVAHFPRIGRAFARILFGRVAPEILSDPELAARTRPIFELHEVAAAEA